MQKGHLLKGSARKILVVKHPSDSGGYTPGDTWELFLGDDGRLREIVLRHGGTVKPAVSYATWADHERVGPLLISMDKRGTGMDSRSTSSSLTWPSSWSGLAPGLTRSRRSPKVSRARLAVLPLDDLLLQPLDEEVHESPHTRRRPRSGNRHRVSRERCQRKVAEHDFR